MNDMYVLRDESRAPPGSSLPGRATAKDSCTVILLASPRSEKPLADMRGHGRKPIVADAFPVVARHACIRVAHHKANRREVAGFLGNRQERVPQTVEAEADRKSVV